jgi:hypothetical protein
VKAIQRRGEELHATLEKDHRLDPDRVLSLLKKGDLMAAAPDAFRVPRAFAGLLPGDAEVCARAGRLLVSLARRAALAGAEVPFGMKEVA